MNPSQGHVLSRLTRNAIRRNPTTAVVLVLFVALSAALASSAGALVVTVTGASASLMQQARTPHFLQMHAGTLDAERIAAFAVANDLVDTHAVVEMLNVDSSAIRITGAGTDTTLAPGLQDNSFVTQNAQFDLLLDTDGAVIDPAPGTVWLPLFYRELLDLEQGQRLTVTGPNGAVHLTVAGFLRDSQMNSSYASSKRLLVAPADLERLTHAVGQAGAIEYLIQFRLTDVAAVGQFETEYRAAGLEANGPTITWTLFVLVNSLSGGITAAIVILVTVLLVAIALLCIRFTLLTTLERDYREIGILKAIGVRDRDLRRLYTRRYLVLAAVGAVVGLVGSLALNRVLLADVRLFLGPAGRTVPSLLLGVALSALIVAVVGLAVRRTLGRLRAVSPVQAIRTGAPVAVASRRRPARLLSALGERPGTPIRLGLRDVLRRPALYAVPLVIYALGAFILILPQNLHTTVTAPDFITYMGAGVSDLRVDAQAGAAADRVADLDRDLAQDPQVASHAVFTTASYTALDTDGVPATVKIESGDLAAFPLTYSDGAAPTADTQIALSRLQADTLGAAVGDRVSVTPVSAGAAGVSGPLPPLDLTVTGIYQDVTNGGHTAKMVAPHTSADLMWTTLYADFAPGVDVPAVIAGYAESYPDLEVSSVRDYVDATMGGTIDALRTVAIAALAIGLAVAALITALFMRLLIVRDAFGIGVMRALGFRDGHVQTQYVVRSAAVLAAGVLLGAVGAKVLGGGLAGMFLSGIGLSELRLIADPWLAYAASPLVLLAVVAVATLASSRPGTRLAISTTIKDQ
ncbi:FtsX-like permease family protein [Occultella aeris]|uniref:FtsX-like permease family protein n=1 Tax=Occultella aeris TaxID=2761496 RepID=A0A7M4DPE6_9MICO|nr:FtsX-like permease family protein [Occultella aeris]VZO39332.1 FtsX-like permease family protein [Occultella aeris]